MDNKIYYDSCYWFPAEVISADIRLQQLITSLHRTHENMDNVQKLTFVRDMPGDYTMIPRYCSIPEEYYPYLNFRVPTNGKHIDIEDNITLKNDRQKESFEWFKNNEYGVLCLKPGEGKTVITIKYICHLKEKTLIVLHKHALAQQWIDRISSFTNISKKQIGMFQTSKPEKSLDKDIVIATVQSLSSFVSKNENAHSILRDAGFGIMVADEVHAIVGPEKFSLASLFVTCPRCYGLSATPLRYRDSDIIFYHLGNVYKPVSKGIDTMTPVVHVFKLDYGICKYWEKYVKPTGKFIDARYYNCLEKSIAYTNCVKKIFDLLIKSDRRTVFLACRNELLNKISKIVPPSDSGIVIGDVKKGREEILNTKKYVFTNYQCCRDGVDVPSWSAMVMGSPTSNIEQCVGRVTRVFPGKKTPFIFDLVDTGCDEMVDRYEWRKKYYKENGYEIHEHDVQ